MKRNFLAAVAAGLVCSTATIGQAQTAWPERTINVIIGASPGGDTDFNARTMARFFEQVTGGTMIVTNMPGGGATIATSAVKDADPDGYTMLFGHTGHLVVTEVSGLANYGIDDFEICCVPAIDQGAVLVASKASGLTTAAEVKERTEKEPKSVTYGTEFGGYSHLQGLIFQKETGADMNLVDTGSASEKIAALLGGRVDVAGIAYGAIQDYHKAGQMVVLGQPNQDRNPLLGEIPTFAEQGINFVMNNPYIIAFPKGTDPAIVAKMEEVMKKITEIPEYGAALEQGFKQPVVFLPHDEAMTRLNAIRDAYMPFREVLQAR